MRLEPAVLGLLEREGEGIEGLVRTKPDEAALAQVDVGLEDTLIARADTAVQAVAGDHQISAVLCGDGVVICHVGLEHEIDTGMPGSALAGC